MDGDGQPDALPRLRFLVKLGGAAITRKQELETLDEPCLATCLAQLRSVLADGDGEEAGPGPGSTPSCVVVHGAGSFGHFQASKWRVAAGTIGNPGAVLGLAETK